jgi:hypothetical protein
MDIKQVLLEFDRVKITEHEQNGLDDIVKIIFKLNGYLNKNVFEERNIELKYWYNYLNNIKEIIGNFNDALSFISCLMEKEYLLNKYSIVDLDVGIKSQSSPGLDIDVNTIENKRIIAEIKTTKSINENDFGSQQKKSIVNDLNKLINAKSDFKYLFVTETNTYNILKNKYKKYFNGIELILLK